MTEPAPTSVATHRLFTSLIRSPLLQFLFFGFCIFMIADWRKNQHESNARTIRVDASLQHYIANLYSVQYGFMPDEETLEYLINNHIRDEVMFREAVRIGLAQEDEIIRRRLIQKMEYLLLDSDVVPEPDQKVLQSWYQSHIADYSQGANASFRHLYFSDDGNAVVSAQARAAAALETADNANIDTVGTDRFPLASSFEQISERSAKQNFGDSAFASAVFSAPEEEWSGPWQSGFGWHLLFVEARETSAPLPFSLVIDKVRSDWLEAAKQARFQEKLDLLLQSYRLERE